MNSIAPPGGGLRGAAFWVSAPLTTGLTAQSPPDDRRLPKAVGGKDVAATRLTTAKTATGCRPSSIPPPGAGKCSNADVDGVCAEALPTGLMDHLLPSCDIDSSSKEQKDGSYP